VPEVHVVAALALGPDGRALLVRKRRTTLFMQPGGKPEPGESAAEALVRELAEEVGVVATEAELTPMGRYEAAAANEPGHTVVAEVFALEVAGSAAAAGEIEEAVWVDPAAPHVALAPLTERLLDRVASRP
jgi:8-oxo-dGTP pyrophosphatase MutT (NUDIX family)